MDTRVSRDVGEAGVSSVQFVLASALALLLFLAFANLVVVQYGRGAIRSALEQGVRAGTLAASPQECESKVDEVVGQLLSGRMSDRLSVRCSIDGLMVVATATAVFESWTVLTPDFEVSLTAQATLEPQHE